MIADWILFFGLALVAVASALGLLLSRSAIYSALNLIINFVTVAIFYLILSAPFIALSQITVYAGAIMVLFLFVIMLLGAESLPVGQTLPWQRPLAVVLGAILIFEAGFYLVARQGGLPAAAAVATDFGSPKGVGLELFNTYLLPFEVVSILLLVAMIGAIVLSRKGEDKV
jgi:NADH-quinone oxidoreductase subunit J